MLFQTIFIHEITPFALLSRLVYSTLRLPCIYHGLCLVYSRGDRGLARIYTLESLLSVFGPLLVLVPPERALFLLLRLFLASLVIFCSFLFSPLPSLSLSLLSLPSSAFLSMPFFLLPLLSYIAPIPSHPGYFSSSFLSYSRRPLVYSHMQRPFPRPRFFCLSSCMSATYISFSASN